MTKIMTCIDGSAYGASVCDHAAWAAQRLGAPVEVVHALGRRDTSSAPLDLSGSLEYGGRENLLLELTELDRQKAKVGHLRGRHIVDEATARIQAAGITDVEGTVRQDDITDTLADLDAETRLVVIGKRGGAADFAKGHLGSNIERVVRSSKKPVLVASRAFTPIERFMVAFDGGRSSTGVVQRLVSSPLLTGIPCHLFMVGDGSGEAGNRLREAEQSLLAAGYAVTVGLGDPDGQPEDVIAAWVKQDGIGFLVMGAYGHSRIRNMIVGSTTTSLIQSCAIPVLVIR